MKKLLFVYNPHSGKGQIVGKIGTIVEILTKAGYFVTIYPTQRALDGYDIVCAADGQYDLIVCSGGDGTLNEILSATMTHIHGKTPIGYIPAGSTNDYARTLGLPKNLIKAAEVIAEGNIISCDMGRMNGRYFNYIAAFGLFTEVSYSTPQNVKNVLGHQAYILESIKSLTRIKNYNMTVTSNDMTFSGEYIFGMISNTDRVGGFKGITGKTVDLNDGLFEVTLVKSPKTPIELQQIVAGMFSKSQKSNMIERFKTNRILIESEESITWTLDGENGDAHQRVEITVIENAIRIISNCGRKDSKAIEDKGSIVEENNEE